ncbi:MAG: PQQ-dependent sugar dehydrogenase, partial [Planctomycetota bacterium]|nr:PQQ-dependent sugar dehydrogenase [Planctomycetota bacterium]
MRTTLPLTASLLLALALAPPAAAQTLGTVRVASGLSSPLYACAPAGDFDRLFIVEQSTARIKILNLSSGSINGTPFLDIGSIASGGGERGLLGLAFHPSYSSNGYFYVNYTDNGGDTVISRYSVSSNANIADSGSALIIFGPQNQPYSNH